MCPMRAHVWVMPKRTVLDPQGQAIQHALASLGFQTISDVRQGKFFVLQLDATRRRESYIADQQKKTLAGIGSWLVSHPEFPATAEAGAKLNQYCTSRGLNAGAWNNLDLAYADLLKSGEIVPDYRASNAALHEQHADVLRANGIQIRAMDFSTATREAIDEFMATQPFPTIEQSQIPTEPTDEPEHVPARDPTFADMFDESAETLS